MQKSYFEEHYYEHLDSSWIIEQSHDGDTYELFFRVRHSPRRFHQHYFESLEEAQADLKKAQAYYKEASIQEILKDNHDRYYARGPVWHLFDMTLAAAARIPFLNKDISPLCDKQQKALYRFENRVSEELRDLRNQPVSKEEALSFLEAAAALYNVSVPKLAYKPTAVTSYSWYLSDSQTIELNHNSLGMLMHEFAHHVHCEKLIEAGHPVSNWHSPEFVRILMNVYADFGGLDRDKLLEFANQENLLGPEPHENLSWYDRLSALPKYQKPKRATGKGCAP